STSGNALAEAALHEALEVAAFGPGRCYPELVEGCITTTNNERMLRTTMNSGRCRAGLLLALCCLLFVASPRCEAQGNLVPNAGFEETDTCSFGLGWSGSLHDWRRAN